MASADVGELRIGLKFDSKELDKSIQQTENKLLKFADVAKNALVTAVVQKGFDVATNAAKNFAGGIVETGKTFQASMSEVAAISGATDGELKLLEQTARDFGKSTQFSASEAAEALKYMSLAGWDANKSSSALGGVLDLAAASGMGLAQASDMVTSYLGAFGLEAEQSSYFADMLAYAQSNSSTTAEELGEAYKNCAANLNAAGQDVETTTSLLSMMANQGLRGSEAGTALNAVMRDMTAKMKDGAIAIGDTAVQVMDASGNYRDMTDILRDVETATNGMGDAERATALASTFTADSIKGMNLIMNAGVEEAAAFEEALHGSDDTAKTMAETMNDNLEGKLKSLNSKFEELQIQLFNNLEPVLNVIIDLLGWCADHADTLIPIVISLGGAIAMVFVADKVNQFFSKTKSIFDSAGKALGKFKDKSEETSKAVSDANSRLSKSADGMAKSASEADSSLAKSADGMATSGESLSTRLSDAIKGIADVVSTVLQSLGQILGSVVDAVMEPIKRIFAGIGEAIAGFFQALANPQILVGIAVFTAAAAAVAAAILMVGSAIGVVTPGLTDFLNNVLIPLGDFIATTVINLLNTVTDCIIRLTQQAIIPLSQEIRTFIDWLFEKFDQVIDKVTSFVGDMIGKAIELGSKFIGNVVEFFSTLPEKIGNFISDVFEKVKTWVTDMVDKAKTMAEDFVNGIVEFFTTLPEKVGNFINDVWEKVKNWATDMMDKAKQAGKDFVDGVVNFVKDLPGKIKEKIDDVIDKVKNFVTDFVNKAKEAGEDFFKKIADKVGELPDKMLEIGSNIVHGIWDGISGAVGWLTDKISGFVNGVMDNIKSFFGIHSPSTLMRDEVGKFMAEGIGVGFADEMESVSAEMAESIELPNMSVEGYGGWTEAVIGLTSEDDDNDHTTVGSDVKITQYNTIENGFDVEQMNQAMLAAMRGV